MEIKVRAIGSFFVFASAFDALLEGELCDSEKNLLAMRANFDASRSRIL